MPGMMDTILNLGLNDDTTEGLKKATSNGRLLGTRIADFCKCTATWSWAFRSVMKMNMNPSKK
jgi:phosphoenolpyruvate synthase/pyruvate phosphate dikinase